MSYLVFARKYRPQTFAEVLGQEAIVRTLTNAIGQNRIGQAYLFSGPRGTGKTSTARIFAKALNCGKGPTAAPCLKCGPCEEITEGRSLDVLEIDGASNRGIDQIRSLRELAKFHPAGGKYKVYIIDEVHQITPEGFNALLKTLEEPPAHVLFVLATTAPHKVPATILSRCQRFEFKRLPRQVIVRKLKEMAAAERMEISEEALQAISKAASGSLRDAESLLDQVAAFSSGPIRPEDVKTLLGVLEEELFAEAMEGIRARDPVRLLRLVAQASDDGADLVQWAMNFLGYVRNLLVARVGAGPLGLEDLEPEAVEQLARFAGEFSVEELSAVAQALASAVEMMRRAGEPRIPLEMTLVRLGSAGPVVSVSELVDRLERMERRLRGPGGGCGAGGASAAPAQAAEERTVDASTDSARAEAPPSAFAPAASAGLERVLAVWPSLLETLQGQKAATAAYLSQGSPLELGSGDPPRLLIGFPKGSEFHCKALSRFETRGHIEKSLATLLGRRVRCEFEVTGRAPTQAPEAKPAPDSPLLSSVLELFEGRVLPGEG